MFKLFYRWTYPLRMFLIDRPWMVVIRHPEFSKFQWYDRDTRLLFCSFQILEDYVDRELHKCPFHFTLEEKVNNSENPNREAWKEVLELYIWWTKKRPARKDPWQFECSERPSSFLDWQSEKYPEYSKCLHEAGEMEDQYYQEDTEMLIRLAKVRGVLWT